MSRRYNKQEAEAEAKERAAELARVAKIKAERERAAAIEAEMKRLQIPRLLAIKGVRRLRPVVVQPVATSLSRRDHFLLETETHLYHYKGEFAPFTSQRTRAVERAQEVLQKERMVPLKLVSVKPDDVKEAGFWDALAGSKRDVGEGVGDNMWELRYNENFVLYRYDAEVGLMPEEDVSCNKLTKKAIFVVAAPGELYVWYGKETGLLRRNQAKSQAVQVYKAKQGGDGVNSWVRIREIHQGSEDYVFRQKFPDWVEMSDTGVPLDPQMLLEIFSRKMLDFNPAKVAQIEDVDGQLDIWVAKDHGKVPISKVSYGEFFDGNSYIVLYQSSLGRVVYFWQGSKSHVSWEHAAESIKAVQKIAISQVDLLRRKKTTIPVVRVGEGDEPPHLLALFNGAFIVRNGHFDSFNRRVVLMYHIRGNDPYSCRVTEASLSRKALRSEDAFLAYSPKVMFLWRGKLCGDFAFRVARTLSKRYISIDTVKLKEGAETPQFWDFLGGKVEMKEMEKKRVNRRKCPKCSHGNPVDCRFCRKCGAPTGPPPGASNANELDASSSDAEGGAVSKQTQAGAAEDLTSLVDGGASEKTGQSTATLARRSSRRRKTIVKKAGTKSCPKCSKRNPDVNRFCRGCGMDLTDVITDSGGSQSESDSSSSSSSLGVQKARSSRKSARSNPSDGLKCGSCSKINKAGLMFCKYCGNALVAAAESPSVVKLKPVAKPPVSSPQPVVPVNPSSDLSESRSKLKPTSPRATSPPQASSSSSPSAALGESRIKLRSVSPVPKKPDETAEERMAKYQESLSQSRSKLRSVSPPSVTVEPVPAKEMRKCEFCGHENDLTDKFCVSCSAPFEKKAKTPQPVRKPAAEAEPPSPTPSAPEVAVVEKIRKCPECGEKNELEARFCLECGGNLQGIEPVPANAPAVVSFTITPVPVVETKAAPLMPSTSDSVSLSASMAAPSEILCKFCGTWNEAECKFCADCGTAIVPIPSSTPSVVGVTASPPPITQSAESEAALISPRPTDESASAVKCPKCRRPNAAGMKFCRKCGWDLAKKSRNKVSAEAEAQRKQEEDQKKEPMKDCRKCGRENPIDCVFCRKCGTRYSEAPKAKGRNPAEDAQSARPTTIVSTASSSKLVSKSAIYCEDPQCAKPNKPGDANCRKCGKPLPVSKPAAQPQPASAIARLKMEDKPTVKRNDSSAFLEKRDKNALQSQVDVWLKKRDESGGAAAAVAGTGNVTAAPAAPSAAVKPPEAAASLSKSSSTIRPVGKLSHIQAKMKEMEEKAAAEKARLEEEQRKKEEEAAALEARRWVQPKVFIIRENSIYPKRSVLQAHLRDPETQVLLDAKDVVWVWFGYRTNKDQMTFTKDLAKFYTKIVEKESQRVAVVKEAKDRQEPAEFVQLFQGWEYPVEKPTTMHHSLLQSTKVAGSDSQLVVLPRGSRSSSRPPQVQGARNALTVSSPAATSMKDLEDDDEASIAPIPIPAKLNVKEADSEARLRRDSMNLTTTKEVLGMYMAWFPLERLQHPETLPPTLNMGSLETYLSDADFFDCFKMTKDKFSSLPAWKKVEMKKKNGLF